MIKAVAFDLWETLITDTPEASRAQERLRLDRLEATLVRSGQAATAERIERAHRELWHRCQALYWESDRDIPTRTQIAHFLEALQLDPASFGESTLQELEHAYSAAALDIPPDAVDHARETLEALKARNLSLGLISNTGRTPGAVLRRILEKLGLAGYLDAMVFSNEHGVCKPQRSIFSELCGLLAVEPSQVVFVGDNIYCDVWGAQQSGMRAVHFEPPRRGTAVGKNPDHGLTIVPDARITGLRQLPDVIAGLQA